MYSQKRQTYVRFGVAEEMILASTVPLVAVRVIRAVWPSATARLAPKLYVPYVSADGCKWTRWSTAKALNHCSEVCSKRPITRLKET